MEPTTAQKIAESIRCDQSMLQTWEERATDQWFERESAAQQAIIDAAMRKQAEIALTHSQAPAKIREYKKRITDQRQQLATWNNRQGVKKVKELASKLREMQGEIDKLSAANPELATAMRDQLKQLGL